MATFTLEYWKDDDWFVGQHREVPGVFSQGQSLDELKENIREAYYLMMEDQQPPSGMPTQTEQIKVESLNRKAFVRELEKAGCQIHRASGRHDIQVNPANGRKAPVPRHREIKNTLCDLVR